MKKIRCNYLLVMLILICVGSMARAENAAADKELFPVYGVTLGKTTVQEMEKLGRKGEDKDFYVINGMTIFYEKNNLASHFQINKNMNVIPEKWAGFGFDWGLSYQQWLELLPKLGYIIQVRRFPSVQIYGNQEPRFYSSYPSFQAEFEAYKNTEYPVVLRFYFNFGKGTQEDSRNTLYSISAGHNPGIKQWTERVSIENKETVTLPEAKRRALAYAGLLGETCGSYHERLEEEDINETNVANLKQSLIKNWGIHNRQELLEMLDSLDKEGHSKSYENVMKILDNHPGLSEIEIGIQNHYEDYIVRRLFFTAKMREIIGNRSLRAWDYGRSISLCRWGYETGYLNEKEAWDRIFKISSKIEALYCSWEDYAAGYIMGRMFWSTSDDHEIEKGNEIAKTYSALIHRQDSVWTLPWSKASNAVKKYSPVTIAEALYCPSKAERAWVKLMDGMRLANGKIYDKAIQSYNEALTFDPNFCYANLYRGHAFYNQHEYPQAINDYLKYAKTKPQDYYGYIYLGDSYLQNNQLDKALENYQQAVKIDASNPDGFIGMARAKMQNEQYMEAIDILEKNEDAIPTNREDLKNYSWYLCGANYYNLKYYDYALSYFLRCYNIYQKYAEPNYYIGICYLKKSPPEKEKAVEYLKKAEKLGMKLPAAIQELLK